MSEVSCKVFDVLVRPLASKGISPAKILEGTSVSLETFHNKRERVAWSDYVGIMRNVRTHFTDQEYVALGRSYLQSPGLRFAFVIARLLLTPMGFYRWLNRPHRGVGNQMFTCIVPTHREINEHEIEVDLILPCGYEVCWDFYLITAGNMEEVPRLLGYPPANVELARIPGGGRFHITVPNRTPLLTRMRRGLAWPVTARAVARELMEANEILVEKYDELAAARTKLDRQTTQLHIAHTVNQLVQRDLDLAHTLETIARALVDEAGFTRAEIRLADGQQHVYVDGAAHEPPIVRTLEAHSGVPVGELRVSPRPGADLGERDELLAFILPSLAMALQNASYRTNLERLVDQRTTELRQARDELAGTVDQLREVQGSRERFFGNISHEIRTPLTIIMLAASNVAHRGGAALDARSRNNLSAVNDAARKLVRLVDELMLLAAGQEGKLHTKPEPTDMAELLRHLVSAWELAAEEAGLALIVRVPEALLANVDPVAIERVASNLISNAVKYTPRGGQVELELAEAVDGIRLCVLDTGSGIDAELASRLFGRFERASSETRRTAGSGIGLSLVKHLVTAHGGSIHVLARESGGSELRVVLPSSLVIRDAIACVPAQLRVVNASIVAPPIKGPMEHAPEGPSRGTILLAEDDVRLAEQIARLLADEYTVVLAHDGLSALELVRQHQPQLLITDVDMPRLDGIELSRRFREITGDRLAPIIILSAMLELGTRLAGLEAGAVDYVTKPFDPLELRARVRAQFRMRDLVVRLHRAEQLSTLGILTSGLAHELRNPANAIVNAVAPLIQNLPADVLEPEHAVSQLVDVIRGCAEQIGALSRQLLCFRGKDTVLDVRPVALQELVQRAVTLAQRALAGVEVRVDIAVTTLTCAPPLMTQVFTNLVENAGHAAGQGGWVEVRATATDDTVTIEVSDSGPGVPPALRERVFEPFFTTKASDVGTGLGLSLARHIAHRHGGVLEIRQQTATSMFVIALPR